MISVLQIAVLLGVVAGIGALTWAWLLWRRAQPHTTDAGHGFKQVSFYHQGHEREYYYYIPESVGPDRPIVLGLHGGTASALAFGRRTGLHLMAERQGFALVLPQSHPNWMQSGTRGVPGTAYFDGETKFLQTILRHMKKAGGFDAKRVFLAGLSRGGMLAYHMACRRPDLVRAIAVVAGTNNAHAKAPRQGAVDLLHIHGTHDQNVPWSGGAGVNSRRGADWSPVKDGIDMFTHTTSDSSENRVSKIAEDTMLVERLVKGKVVLEVCLVNGGGHAWPGSEPSQLQISNDVYVSPHFDATDYIGKFFSRY